MADKSIFQGAENELKAEKKSSIQIYDSSLKPFPKNLKKNITVEPETALCHKSTLTRVACKQAFAPSIEKFLKKHESFTDSSIRGVLQ